MPNHLIDHAVTFGCGIVCGAAGAFIAMMISRMWRDTHGPKPYRYKVALINIEVLSHIRQCMHRWASRYSNAEHTRRHVMETRTLVQQVDEILLDQ